MTGPRRPAAPAQLAVPALVAVGFLVVPLLALLWRTPWSRLGPIVTDPAVRSALVLSLWTASVSTAVCLLLGVPLAWLLARTAFRGRGLLRGVVTLPLVLPPVVGGLALLLAFGRTGMLGRYLYDWLGVSLPFTPAAVVVAETFVALPFLVIAVEGTVAAAGTELEEIAETLGATRFATFRRVTLPHLAPAIGAGAALCWARALGEFGATITFAGSLPGRTQTMPVAVYYALETAPDAALGLSVLLLLVSVAVLVGLRGHWLRGGAPA